MKKWHGGLPVSQVMSLFSNRDHLQEAKQGPWWSTKPPFKSSWYFKHSMRYFPPMNAEMLVHREMLATSIIKPSRTGGRIFLVSTVACYFSMFIVSPEVPAVTGDTNISTVNYLQKRKILWLLGLLSPGIYLFISAAGRFFCYFKQAPSEHKKRDTSVATDFKATLYTHAEDKSSVGIFTTVSLCHCCKLLTQLCHLRISQSGSFFFQ